jgi:rubrerythrin
MKPKSQKHAMYNEVIQFAISKEQEAIDLYSDMAGRVRSPGSKVMFKELADMEKGHKAKLEKVDKTYFAKKKVEVPLDLKISDYLVDVQLKSDSSYQDILLYAAKRERAAYDLYTDLAQVYASVPEIKKMFAVLAQEEAGHKLKLEREYDDNVYKEG